ncbi:MAG: ADP-ribosylglycohydrolase family protein [Treponema sp.]|jgi:hypothetical protein|nr:ADP-ribosylglycohydrolase family protein [Treponema sp.]
MPSASLRTLPEISIRSGGFVINTLEAAFWCFLTTDSYRDAVLKAVNLGDDTDTTAAVTGALAGLFYGLDAIPAIWLETLAGSGDIRRGYGGGPRGLKYAPVCVFAGVSLTRPAEKTLPAFITQYASPLQTGFPVNPAKVLKNPPILRYF